MSSLPSVVTVIGSLFAEAKETAATVIVLVFAALGTGLALVWALDKTAPKVIVKAREGIDSQRGTGIPALFTLIGAVGAATTNVIVSPLVGCAFAIAIAVITYISACLAEDWRNNRLARLVSIAGCVLPVLIFTAAALASDQFERLSTGEEALVVSGLALGWAGVLYALAALKDEPAPVSD